MQFERAAEGLSVLVATRGRPESLERLLESLAPESSRLEDVLLVANGTEEELVAASIDSVVERHRAALPMLRAIASRPAGKARALNAGLAAIRGEWVAFLDDDVVVEPGWAAALLEAFADGADGALQGAIVWGEDGVDRDALRTEARRWNTLPRVDDELVRERGLRTLTGANMAVAKQRLVDAGGFDERLGPGAGGLCEDTDLAVRLGADDAPLRYVPGARVRHELDASRLTAEYWAAYHRRLGRSRYLMKGNSLVFSILPNLAKAAVLSALTMPVARSTRHLRHVAKYIVYREMLRCSLAPATPDTGGAAA